MKAFAAPLKRPSPGPRLRPGPAPTPAGALHPRPAISGILHSAGPQAKLEIGAPGDRLEREADRVAGQVMRMPDTPVEAEEETEEEEGPLQARELPGETPAVPPGAESRIEGLGAGQALGDSSRAFFEPRFGQDFSGVRIHTGAEAQAAAASVRARAFTLGPSIVFGKGEFAPETAAGRNLLAHELTHVVQQGGGPTAKVRRQPFGVDPEIFGTTNYAFDTYNVTEGHLSDPDVVARFNALSRDQLVDYRNRVHDPAVQIYIDGLIAGLPAAGPIRLIRVEVVPASRRNFSQVPGTGAGTHWVGVASRSAARPIVQAVTDPVVAATDPRVAGLVWSGPGLTPVSGNPLQAEVDRTAARRRPTATLGGDTASTTLWAVFATISATTGPDDTFDRGSTAGTPWGRPGGNVRFSATILPSSILTDADRPNLAGGNDTDPPGGNHWSGGPLSGGADRHWDFSRKMRTRLINPDAIATAGIVVPGGAAALFYAAQPIAYPAAWEEGNDDRATGDENNDPYAGAMTSVDPPGMRFNDTAGADGNTFEIRFHFREFVRLEINRRWWVISAHFPWRVHARAQRVGGRWVDDTTTAAADNAGF